MSCIRHRFGTVTDSPVHCYRYLYIYTDDMSCGRMYTYVNYSRTLVRLEPNIKHIKKDHCYNDCGGTKHYCFYDNALSRYCQINSTLFNGPHVVFRILLLLLYIVPMRIAYLYIYIWKIFKLINGVAKGPTRYLLFFFFLFSIYQQKQSYYNI